MISPAGNERLEPWTPFSPCTSATLSLAQKARCSLAPVFVLLHVSRSDYKILKAWQGKTGPGQQGTVCTGSLAALLSSLAGDKGDTQLWSHGLASQL